MLYTVTNLYPYPDQPTRGVFNAQLFHELAKRRAIENIVLVANSKPWTWGKLRSWKSPVGGPVTRYVPYLHVPVAGRNLSWMFVAHALKRLQMFTGGHQVWSLGQHDASDPSVGQQALPSDDSAKVILASWLYPDGVGTSQALHGSDGAVWVMVLGSDSWHLRNPARRKIILKQDKRISGYICVSGNLVDALSETGIERSKLHLIRNGVDTEKFYELAPAQIADWKRSMKPMANESIERVLSLVSASSAPLMGWIGNFIGVKAPGDALRAFSRLVHNVGHAGSSFESTPQLVMIGDGPLLPRMRELAGELDVAAHLHFLGWRPHAEVPKWLNLMDCLLLSSHSEGMPNVVAEALACGTPVVATNVGACKEMLNGQPRCGTVEAKDIEGLAAKLSEVCRNARSCAERPVFTRTWGDMADEICELMR